MTKLFYLMLLAIVMIGFGNQMTSAQGPELPITQSRLDQACIGTVDPLNPSPLTFTDRTILAVTCLNQENSQNPVSPINTLTYTDRAILYWTSN